MSHYNAGEQKETFFSVPKTIVLFQTKFEYVDSELVLIKVIACHLIIIDCFF